MTRFEPATSGSTDRRSNQLSYIHHKSSIVIILIFGRFCQKNFPPRFCKPGRTDKQPLIESAAGHKKPSRRANFPKRSLKPHRARPKRTNSAGSGRSTRDSNPLKHANTARGKRSTGCAHSSRRVNLARLANPPGAGVLQGRAPKPTHPAGHAIPSAHTPPPGTPQTHQFHQARVLQGHAMQTPPGVAPLFSRCRRLRGGQVAQALAHLVLCQYPFFRRPQAHL